MQVQTAKAQVILAIKAIQSSQKLSIRAAAKLYNVPRTTLSTRMDGWKILTERWLANQLLTKIKEEVVV